MSEEEVESVISSIEWVASYGYLLLPFYAFDPRTGNWTLKKPLDNPIFRDLADGNLNSSKFLQALIQLNDSATRRMHS
jgi:hypothetical protein